MNKRWYDFLRDDSITPLKPIIEDTHSENFLEYYLSFFKDNWQYYTITGGVIIVGGLVFAFWDPLSEGAINIGSSIKNGLQKFIPI